MRDKMNRSEHIRWVEEAQCLRSVEREWGSAVQCEFVGRLIKPVPMRPAKVYSMRGVADRPIWQLADIRDVGVENPDNPGIKIWVLRITQVLGIQKQHDVALRGIDVYDVLFPSHIVGRVVEPDLTS